MKQLILSKLKNPRRKNMSVLAASHHAHSSRQKIDGSTNIIRLTRAHLDVRTGVYLLNYVEYGVPLSWVFLSHKKPQTIGKLSKTKTM